MELQVSEIQSLEPIKFNFEELKLQITTKLENYKSITYTEDTIKEAKTDRANLNKLAKALNDEKIRVKNKVLEPYTPFEKQCNELIDLVKEASTHADVQIKNFEQQAKDEKLQKIMNFFIEKVGEYKDLIDFDKIYNERWLNVTFKMDQVEKEIEHIITKTKTDLIVIDSQFTDESINKAAKMEYFDKIADPSVLTLSILKGNSIVEQNKKLEELKQKEQQTQSTQNITNSTENLTESTQKITENQEKVTESVQNVESRPEKTSRIDFSVDVTYEQMNLLKRFLVENNIVPKQGITNNDVNFLIGKIMDKVEECREDGETDLRTILYFIQTMEKHIDERGTKETVKELKQN